MQFPAPSFSTRNPRSDLCAVLEHPRPHEATYLALDGWVWQALWFPSEKPLQRVVVSFHGFGRPMKEMGNYLPVYDGHAAMLSVGITHQNGSTAPSTSVQPPVLHPSTMQHAIDAWLAARDMKEVPKHLLGYSLGGRLALTLFEQQPETWSGMVLLASDGFKKNAMYRFAVDTALGRAMWSLVDRHAETARSAIRGLRRLRIIPAHLEHFALHHTQDHAMRALVSNTWKTHRLFWPSKQHTATAWRALPERGVHIHAVFGTRDAIIPWTWSKPWHGLGNHHVHFARVDSGHVMRHPETVEALSNLIFHTSDEHVPPQPLA